jgi:hypothetical protein
MDAKTEIASGFTVGQYLSMRDTLDPLDVATQEWSEVLDAFERRMMERFWGPIHQLEVDDALIRPGFAIVALCCMVIETLNSFENGSPLASRGPSKLRFIEFLEERIGMAHADAVSLYRAVRNKLLHDGETRENWKILRGKDKEIVTKQQFARVLNRIPFRKALEREYRLYCGRLRMQDQAELRKHFLSRLNILCDAGEVYAE